MSPRRPEQFEEIRAKSREKILTAALEQFATNGYHSTSISKIAKEAGVSKGLIYNYFDSKKSMLLAIFQDAMKLGMDIVDKYNGVTDPYERLRSITEDAFEFMINNTHYHKLLTSIAMQPGVMEDIEDFTEQSFAKNQELVKKLYEQTDNKDPYMSGLMYSAVMDGVSMAYFMLGDRYPIVEMKQRVIEEYCTPKKKRK